MREVVAIDEIASCGWPEKECDFCQSVADAACDECDALVFPAEDGFPAAGDHFPGCSRREGDSA